MARPWQAAQRRDRRFWGQPSGIAAVSPAGLRYNSLMWNHHTSLAAPCQRAKQPRAKPHWIDSGALRHPTAKRNRPATGHWRGCCAGPYAAPSMLRGGSRAEPEGSLQLHRGVQLEQFPPRHSLDIAKPADSLTVKKGLGVSTREGTNYVLHEIPHNRFRQTDPGTRCRMHRSTTSAKDLTARGVKEKRRWRNGRRRAGREI